MNFDQLLNAIEKTSNSLQEKALTSVNQSLVIRNWLTGLYIVEFEQNGEDRAAYGEKLLDTIALELKKKKLKGLSATNLRLFRRFYDIYPHIGPVISNNFNYLIDHIFADFSDAQIQQPVAAEFKNVIYKPVADKTDVYSDPQLLLQHFSFRHFTELIKIKEPLKRTFYEQQAIKGNWSSRQLKRQIESLLLERTGLSKNKDVLLKSVQDNQHTNSIEDTIKDPYILEFTGFKELPVYSENDLETSLLNKIQDFLIELGHGFCFEARQKRITIGNEHDRIDLVFYHRILKCHVLIDLKVRAFTHADTGQMNFYLNYYKKNMMESGDNPPVGIILCTDKDEVKVEYAVDSIDHQLFVSKYLVELPSKEELEKLLTL